VAAEPAADSVAVADSTAAAAAASMAVVAVATPAVDTGNIGLLRSSPQIALE